MVHFTIVALSSRLVHFSLLVLSSIGVHSLYMKLSWLNGSLTGTGTLDFAGSLLRFGTLPQSWFTLL